MRPIPRLQSWTLLLVGAVLFAVGAVGFGAMGLWSSDEIPPGAAIAYLGLIAIGIASFLLSLPIAWLFRRGGPGKSVAAAFTIVATSIVFYASGWFLGFLPLWMIGTGIGALALYEEHAS